MVSHGHILEEEQPLTLPTDLEELGHLDEYLLENAHISDRRQMITTMQKKCRRPQRLHFWADKLKATFETTLQQIIIPCFHKSTLTT